MSQESRQEETEFSPVWISSIEHLDVFASIFQGKTRRSLFTQGYDIPPEFPHTFVALSNYIYVLLIPSALLSAIHTLFYTPSYYSESDVILFSFLWIGLLIFCLVGLAMTLRNPQQGFPLHFFSNGTLRIEEGKVTFVAVPFKAFGNRYLNLKSDLEFQMKPSDIVEITRYEPPRLFPFGRQSDIKWIRVTTNESILGGDFLIIVGGKGFRIKKRITECTNRLYQLLIEFKDGTSEYNDDDEQSLIDIQSESDLEDA